MSPKEFNFVDIFSGAGGLSCGLEMTGMKCLLGVDIDKYAMQSFAINHPHAQIYCDDISKLSKERIGALTGHKKIHAVVGGPPCQGFSTVGIGNPKDMRNKLFMQFVRIVDILRPSFVVLENVTGLLAKKNEKTLRAIFTQFEKLGYHMDVRIMSADDYGVPEKRRRTIIIGTTLDTPVIFPKALCNTTINGTVIAPKTVGDAIANLKSQTGEIHNHDINAAQISSKIDYKRLKRIPEGKGIRYPEDEKAYLTKALKLNVDWNKIPEGRFRQTKYQRLDRTKPSPTIMTHRHSYFHPVEDRYLTAREAAAIQSFPNDFIFQGPISAQWRQIGNAVPPLLGKAIGGAIWEMIKTLTSSQKKNRKKSKVHISHKINSIREKAFHYR